MAEDVPEFDAKRLIADLRKDDPAAVRQAYRWVFASDLGRFVLAHFMADCGVGTPFGLQASDTDVRYVAGQHDAALKLAGLAGFDRASVAVAELTFELTGTEDDEHANYTPAALELDE